jgi:hypothetical protein
LRRQREGLPDIVRPAVAEIGVEPGQRAGRHGGQLRETRIVPLIAGQQRKRGAMPAAERADLLHAVAPIREAAEQPDDDGARPRDHLLGVQVDRHRVAQALQVGEAQAGPFRPHRLPRRRRGPEVAVGEGQEHEIRRRLAEIHRARLFVQ